MEFIIVSAREEGALLRNDLETPHLAIVVRRSHDLLVAAINFHGGDSSILMSNEYLAAQNVDGGGLMESQQWNLSYVLEVAFVCGVDGNLVVFSSGAQDALVASDGGALSSMSFKNESKLAPLVPAMHASIGSTTVAESFLVEDSTKKLGLSILLAESSVLKQLLGGVSRVPELQ